MNIHVDTIWIWKVWKAGKKFNMCIPLGAPFSKVKNVTFHNFVMKKLLKIGLLTPRRRQTNILRREECMCMFPGPAVPVCSLVSFHFLWAIQPIRPVQCVSRNLRLLGCQVTQYEKWTRCQGISGRSRLRSLLCRWEEYQCCQCHPSRVF